MQAQAVRSSNARWHAPRPTASTMPSSLLRPTVLAALAAAAAATCADITNSTDCDANDECQWNCVAYSLTTGECANQRVASVAAELCVDIAEPDSASDDSFEVTMTDFIQGRN